MFALQAEGPEFDPQKPCKTVGRGGVHSQSQGWGDRVKQIHGPQWPTRLCRDLQANKKSCLKAGGWYFFSFHGFLTWRAAGAMPVFLPLWACRCALQLLMLFLRLVIFVIFTTVGHGSFPLVTPLLCTGYLLGPKCLFLSLDLKPLLQCLHSSR